jgi:serine kinase of HPr protein (carbohydrate metabolism regulator)
MENIHATAFVLGGAGILVSGASGSGKTALARLLVGRWRDRGRFAALVADDRVLIERCGGRMVARAPEPIAGLWEQRGFAIAPAGFEAAAVVDLVGELVAPAAIERLPEPAATLRLPAGDPAWAADLVEAALLWQSGHTSA